MLATDPATGKTKAETVTAVWLDRDTDLLDLVVRTSNGDSNIHTTRHHSFYDLTRHHWVDADQLRPGERLYASNGSTVTVVAERAVAGTAAMWDLTVAGDHDFYVVTRMSPLLVHNCGGGEPIAPGDIHGILRQAEREVDVAYVLEHGDLYIQEGEPAQTVRVLDNGNGTSDVVIRDPANPSGAPRRS